MSWCVQILAHFKGIYLSLFLLYYKPLHLLPELHNVSTIFSHFTRWPCLSTHHRLIYAYIPEKNIYLLSLCPLINLLQEFGLPLNWLTIFCSHPVFLHMLFPLFFPSVTSHSLPMQVEMSSLLREVPEHDAWQAPSLSVISGNCFSFLI